MHVVIIAVNARFSHVSLAAASLRQALLAGDFNVDIAEFNINQQEDRMLEKLVEHHADLYLFSCYIWNIEIMKRLGSALRKLMPEALFAAGGPEVGGAPWEMLRRFPQLDFVLWGEGEQSCAMLLAALAAKRPYSAVPGLWWRAAPGAALLQWYGPSACGKGHAQGAAASLEDTALISRGNATGAAEPASLKDLDTLPFAFTNLPDIREKTLYYESMRGCPYRCSYCLSGAGAGAVRYKGLEKVYGELGRFLDAGVRQLKFVDRTFNCDPKRALEIWRFLAKNDNGRTNFHFELAGHLLDEPSLEFLQTVRPGLFQFEIGVQSANPETLKEIHRPGDTALLFQKVDRLRAAGNIHLHLDLIAGLPHEDYAGFGRSFDTVCAHRPHQLQLGFLKVLPGSEMEARAGEYGAVYRDAAPYEVLYTKWMSFADLARLKETEEMVELYYNSGRFNKVIEELSSKFASSFKFYESLAAFYRKNGCREVPPGKVGHYQLLGEFAMEQQARAPQDMAGNRWQERLQWLCRYDMALHEKPRVMPQWVTVEGSHAYRQRILDFYAAEGNLERYLPAYAGWEPKKVLKQAHVEVFPFDPEAAPETGKTGECAILFDYSRRDVTGRALAQRIVLG